MDDFNINNLNESKNEWSAQLINILTPRILEGFNSILIEAIKLCKKQKEPNKYLVTFQNFLETIPKWNQETINKEKKRICEKSGCDYLEDLITCVHVIIVKLLTAMRVGQKQKKIDITIPRLNDFIHKVYIHCSRKMYTNAYLFEQGLTEMQKMKNNNEKEKIIKECILNAIRESMPIQNILKSYLEESEETVVVESPTEIKSELPIEHDTIKEINNDKFKDFNSYETNNNNNNDDNKTNESNAIKNYEIFNDDDKNEKKIYGGNEQDTAESKIKFNEQLDINYIENLSVDNHNDDFKNNDEDDSESFKILNTLPTEELTFDSFDSIELPPLLDDE